MDIVYTTTKDAPGDFLELRYSIRSARKHVKNLRKIIIVGTAPVWAKGIKEIPFPDEAESRAQNVFQKLLAVCEDPEVSEEFLYMADDHFFTQEIEPRKFPYYYKEEKMPAASEARKFLEMIGKGFKDFKIHTPYKIKKSEFIQTPWNYIDPVKIPIRSVYCNYWGKEGEKAKDPIILNNYSPERVRMKSRETGCFSSGGMVTEDPAFKETMLTLYPKPSEHEI